MSTHNANFFVAQGALRPNAVSYIARKADEDLLRNLRAGEFCYILDPRQMGKSSLIARASVQLRAEQRAVAILDLVEIGQNVTVEQWYYGQLLRIGEQIGLSEELDRFWKEHKELSPLQRWVTALIQAALPALGGPLVVFVDEIDYIRNLENSMGDEYLTGIRACYMRRANDTVFEQLSFCLAGVATPAALIQSQEMTPFNIGQSIKLRGFSPEEAIPTLCKGLASRTANPEIVLQEILNWTGGQPFLTQKICRIVVETPGVIPMGAEAIWTEELILKRILQNWEEQDEPIHLGTIRDRIAHSAEKLRGRALGLYQRILQEGAVPADNSEEQMELRLTGLVSERGGKLYVYNRIYASIFDLDWVERILANMRPYAEALSAWQTSGKKEEAWLLRGIALTKADEWAADKSVSDLDYQFLAASHAASKAEEDARRQAKLEQQQRLEAEKDARQQRRYRNSISVVAVLLFGLSIGLGALYQAKQRAEQTANGLADKEKAEKGEKDRALHLEQDALIKVRDQAKQLLVSIPVERGRMAEEIARQPGREVEALVTGIQAVGGWYQQESKFLISAQGTPPPTPSEALAGLRAAVDAMERSLLLRKHNDVVGSVMFPDDRLVITTGIDGVVHFWDPLQGEEKGPPINTALYVQKAALSPDRRYLALVSSGGDIQAWDRVTKKALKQFKVDIGIDAITLTPDNNHVLTAESTGNGTEGYLDRFNLRTGDAEGDTRNIKGDLYAFSRDGKSLATVGQEGIDHNGTDEQQGAVYIYPTDNVTESLIFNFEHSTDYVKASTTFNFQLVGKREANELLGIAYSAETQRVAIGTVHGTVYLCDLKRRRCERLSGHQGQVTCLAFSKDGRRLLTGGNEGIAFVWNVAASPAVRTHTLKGHYGWITAAAFAPDGHRLVTGSFDRTARLWNLYPDDVSKLDENALYQRACTLIRYQPEYAAVRDLCSIRRQSVSATPDIRRSR